MTASPDQVDRPVCDLVDAIAVVGDHDNGTSLIGLAFDESLNEVDCVAIESRVGFVEEQQRTVDHQFPSELGSPLHPV